MTRSLSTILVLALGLLLLSLAACSSQEEPAQAEEQSAKPAPPAARPITPQPVASSLPASNEVDAGQRQLGGRLVLASMVDYPHRDVHKSNQETLATMGPGLAYSRLLRLSTGPGVQQPSLTLECDLCESWELAPDMSYVFRLRPEVYWHDLHPVNGRQLVAQDIEFSYQRMRTAGWPGAARFAERGIGDIEAIDGSTLKVNLVFRDADALLALADGHSKIVAPEVVDEYGDLRKAPVVGTGPWVHEPTSAGSAEYFGNSDYFEPGLPYLDAISVKAVGASESREALNPRRLAMFRAGQVDVMVVPPTDWKQLEQSSEEFNSRISQQPEIGLVMTLNTQQAPLNNLAVRRAIFRAVDPWEYVDVDWEGQGGVGMGMPVSSPYWQLAESEMLGDYLGSPSGARDILSEAEIFYPPPLEITVSDLGPEYRRVAAQVAEDLQSVGFKATVNPVSPDVLHEKMFGPDRSYQVALGPVPPHPTTNGYLYSVLHSRGPGNVANHQDEVVNALIEAQSRELDPEQRQQRLLDLQRRVLDQAYMFSPITGSYRWVFDWRLENFYPNTALSEYHYWTEAWLSQ